MTPFVRQVLLLSLFSWLLVTPQLWKTGTNIVTQTYEQASDRFWQHSDIYAYPKGKGDWFKYSPFFAFAYTPFAKLPSSAQALAWAFLNSLLFWWGISRWFVLSRKKDLAYWAAFVLCSMELDISLRYQQVNALMTGMLLLGLADYRDEKLSRSAALLTLNAGLKVLPALFLGFLLYPFRMPFARTVLLWTGAVFLVPAAILGFQENLSAHVAWAHRLVGDVASRGLLDVHTLFLGKRLPEVGVFLRDAVAIVTFGVLGLMRAPKNAFSWPLWYSVGAIALLLLNPRTESPTFILMAPAYLFLLEEARHYSKTFRKALTASVFVVGFIVTFVFTDLWPKAFWNPLDVGFATKTLGCLALWGLAAYASLYLLLTTKKAS